MDIASKKAVYPQARRIAARWLKSSGKMAEHCSTLVFDPRTPPWFREIPAVEILRQIWVQNYFWEDGHVRWREAEDLPPATKVSLTRHTTPKLAWAKSAALCGPAMCAASVHMKFLHHAGEVESKTTSRTMTYLEGKPEEENSMSLKRRTAEGMYAVALQVLCAG
jgi:hypothetical protein